MPRLGNSESAFVRPLPSAGALGGVTVNLDDAARLCELAGYHRILVETVGVGQSEVDVALLCDVLVMLVVPGTGDELQAVKRGITEVTDILAVNKVDRAPEHQVRSLMAAYSEGLGLMHGASASIVACSATSGQGVAELADLIERRALTPKRPRAEKREALFRRLLEHALLRRFWEGTGHAEEFLEILECVRSERLTLRAAAERALRILGALTPQSHAHGNRA
jgi:LAO/AO transport system kinase